MGQSSCPHGASGGDCTVFGWVPWNLGVSCPLQTPSGFRAAPIVYCVKQSILISAESSSRQVVHPGISLTCTQCSLPKDQVGMVVEVLEILWQSPRCMRSALDDCGVAGSRGNLVCCAVPSTTNVPGATNVPGGLVVVSCAPAAR